MAQKDSAVLEQLPEAAFLVCQGRVVATNGLARHYLKQLTTDDAVPETLELPEKGQTGQGEFLANGVRYAFRATPQKERTLVVFTPAAQHTVSDRQLDGFLRQIRGLMGDVSMALGAMTDPEREIPGQPAEDMLSKSYYRAFRLLDGMELLRRAERGDALLCRPVTMDLAGLCRHTAQEAEYLLKLVDVALDYAALPPSLLMPGDPELLRKLLVELIANAARACGAGGSVTIRLKYHSGRATLTVTHSGPPSGERQLSALLQQDGDYLLPLPGQGAGLGMSVVRQIVNLHEGSMLVEWSDGAPTVVVSLPTGPLPGRLPLESPRFSMGAGLHPTLVGLADLLPAEVFGEEGLD